jgi:hypothetical protein
LNQRCLEALPSASELIVGAAQAERLPAPAPGATRRRRRSVLTHQRAPRTTPTSA